MRCRQMRVLHHWIIALEISLLPCPLKNCNQVITKIKWDSVLILCLPGEIIHIIVPVSVESPKCNSIRCSSYLSRHCFRWQKIYFNREREGEVSRGLEGVMMQCSSLWSPLAQRGSVLHTLIWFPCLTAPVMWSHGFLKLWSVALSSSNTGYL